MRPPFMIASLFGIVAGLAWLQATPVQRHQWLARLHGVFAPTPHQPDP